MVNKVMNIISIFTWIVAGAMFLIVIMIIIGLSQYIFWHHFRKCKNCGCTMTYKGTRDEDGETYYLFHCKFCGKWEKVSTIQMFREIDGNYNEE